MGCPSPGAPRRAPPVKSECLDRMILFGERALRHVLKEYAAHYHFERNHQGIGNDLIIPQPGAGKCNQVPGKIRRAVEVLPPKGCARIATAMNLCLEPTFDYCYGQSIARRIACTPFQVEKLPAYVDLLHAVARMNILTPRVLRGLCASKNRDKRRRQLQLIVMRVPQRSSSSSIL